jgi:ubiquinone biosynthesis protein COQ9
MPKKPSEKMKKSRSTGKTPLEKMDKILLAAMSRTEKTGWSDELLASKEAAELFPDGAAGLVRHFHDWADRKMLEKISKTKGFRSLKIREKIAAAARARLEELAPFKPAAEAALAWHARPWHAASGLKALYATVDEIWKAAGDTATDYNFYTKRGLLAGVYSATLLFWLNDKSENHTATWDFLARRIDNVLSLGKITGKAKTAAQNASAILRRRKAA